MMSMCCRWSETSTPSVKSEISNGRLETIDVTSEISEPSGTVHVPSSSVKSNDAESRYYATRIPLAQRKALCFQARTVSKAKLFVETFNTGNYIWVFYYTLFDHTGDAWAVWVQISIFILYMIFTSTFFFYDSWSERDDNTREPIKPKHFFSTLQQIESRYKRLLLKFLYITGFGKLFQHYFASISKTDEDFHNEIEGVLWLTYSELFMFYIPTVLLKTIQHEISGHSLSTLPILIACYLCTVKNVVVMISKQNYAHWKDYLSMFIVTTQVGPDIFFRTYTFAIMVVHISPWTILIMFLIYCTLNFFDNDWFESPVSRIFYGLLFTPLHTVSNLQFLYSSTLDCKMILFEHFLRAAIGSSIFIFEVNSYGSISSLLIISSFILATVSEIYILAYHDFFKTRDKIT